MSNVDSGTIWLVAAFLLMFSGFFFRWLRGKLSPIIDSLIVYYLAFTSKHPILHDPAVLFVIGIVVVAATLSGMVSIQNSLEKRKNNQNSQQEYFEK